MPLRLLSASSCRGSLGIRVLACTFVQQAGGCRVSSCGMCRSCAPAPIVAEGRTNDSSPAQLKRLQMLLCELQPVQTPSPLLVPLGPICHLCGWRCSWRPAPAGRARQRLLCGQLDPILTVVAAGQGYDVPCSVSAWCPPSCAAGHASCAAGQPAQLLPLSGLLKIQPTHTNSSAWNLTSSKNLVKVCSPRA